MKTGPWKASNQWEKNFRRRAAAPAVAEFADLEGWRLDAERGGKVSQHPRQAELQLLAQGVLD
jgi:hypothetical protein